MACIRPLPKYLDPALSLQIAKDRAGIDAADVTQDEFLNDMLAMTAGTTTQEFSTPEPVLPVSSTVYRPYLVAALALEQDAASQLPSEGQQGGLGPFPLKEADGVVFNIRERQDRQDGLGSLRTLQSQLDQSMCLDVPMTALACTDKCEDVRASRRRGAWSGQITSQASETVHRPYSHYHH